MSKESVEVTKVLVKGIVEDKGYPVHLSTPYCEAHKENHSNCRGCESEPGCSRFVKILALGAMMGHLEKPTTLSQLEEQQKEFQARIEKILEGGDTSDDIFIWNERK